jgi:hypothetical protein
MKVEVSLHYCGDDEQIYCELVDLGKYDRDRHEAVERHEEEASELIREAMANWLIFPGAIITVTAPNEKEAACFSSRHGYVE